MSVRVFWVCVVLILIVICKGMLYPVTDKFVAFSLFLFFVFSSSLFSICHHQFVLGLVATCQDRDSVYLILDFLQGGDLFGLLEKLGTLSVSEAQFYMGCTVEALAYVHGRNIAFRDLKLENLVLDKTGYCQMVDFGLAKRVLTRTYTVCGSPRYCAPEIVTGRGHCHFVDW